MWKKLGQVFCPENLAPWMVSHAALPVPILLDGTRLRVYFCTRSSEQVGSIGWVDLQVIDDSFNVINVAPTPVLSAGPVGSFDDSGIGLGCVTSAPDGDRIYYMGWNLGKLAPWRNSIGVAVGDAREGRFERWSAGPIIDRSPADPYSLSYPWVVQDGAVWRMWYGSNLAWGADESQMRHVVKSATSTDGYSWTCSGAVAIGLDHPWEYAVARPCVLRHNGKWRMWYVWRGKAYRIGYAESTDGDTWCRKDDSVGIDPSADGWDSEMLCYPCVFRRGDALYLLYNGNRYGRTGFGIARWHGDLG